MGGKEDLVTNMSGPIIIICEAVGMQQLIIKRLTLFCIEKLMNWRWLPYLLMVFLANVMSSIGTTANLLVAAAAGACTAGGKLGSIDLDMYMICFCNITIKYQMQMGQL
ncbi:hypothetical protein ACJX0J_036533 [Zea mays]